MKTSNGTTFKVIGFSILAGIVGAGIAVLVAPHKGSKTRKKLADTAEHIAEDVEDKIKDQAEVLSKKAVELKDETMSAIEEIVKDIKHKATGLVHH